MLTTLNASDADRGYAGILQFACWDELFEVNVHSGELRVAGRLHELMHREISNNDSTNEMSIQHRLNIMVCDMGDPVKCTNATLNVTVVDSNNNAPLFDKVLSYSSSYLWFP
ncbi:unnamed protein product [Anisakis simplex]|uniref:Cadherin domain-containing protein n=1 Tax=Anisakis simplex TaxID=6269 RepID=A0A3P6PYK2_ANISI|nr:unnamed protein product [Anisakis simplex]